MAPVGALAYGSSAGTGDADRRRYRRHDLRRFAGSQRPHPAHARDLARQAACQPHDRHAVGRRAEHRRRRRFDRLGRPGAAPPCRPDQRRRHAWARPPTGAAAPGRPSPTRPSSSASSIRISSSAGSMALDTAAAEEALRRDVAVPARQVAGGSGDRGDGTGDREHGPGDHGHHASTRASTRPRRPSSRAAAPAGLNCVAIARRLGCRRVLVPEPGAALAAAGALISDLTSRYHAMFHAASDSVRPRRRQRGARRASRSGAAPSPKDAAPEARPYVIAWSTEARYPDQAWEIEVPLRGARFDRPMTSPGCSRISTARTRRSSPSATRPRRSRPSAGTRRCVAGSAPQTPGRVRSAGPGARLPSRRVRFLQAREARDGRRLSASKRSRWASTIAGPAIVESELHLDRHRSGRDRAARRISATLVIDVGA